MCEKCAKMEMEFKIAKLEFEKEILQEKLKCQEMITERNALQAKIAMMELEKKMAQKMEKPLEKADQTEQNEVIVMEEQNGVPLNAKQQWDESECFDDPQIIGDECLRIRCEGHSFVWRTVFAKHSISHCANSSGIFYFEISFVKLNDTGAFIGFANKQKPFLSVYGRPDTYAYQSDGTFYINGFGLNRRRTFCAGDVIGCGVNLATRQIIFTKNGRRLDATNLFISPSDANQLFPFVSLYFEGDEIVANFGAEKFKFDLSIL
ncbi:hypothetical protein niasHT_004536 [Heterodera trifolii]|uniref:B30.2/SPRY domain-containing protein n=1 Tax=Heterodera trifolii TaxID=157864 RepID=A0ABD2M068_9BILA